MKQHYVEFCSPGSFFNESSIKRIDSWDIEKAVDLSADIKERHGATPFGFKFITKLEHQPIPDGEGGTLEVKPKIIEQSGMHFLGGTIETYDDVVNRNDPKESILQSNMRCNRWWLVIINTNSYKSCQPFSEKDCIINTMGKIIRSGTDKDLKEYVDQKNKEHDPYMD